MMVPICGEGRARKSGQGSATASARRGKRDNLGRTLVTTRGIVAFWTVARVDHSEPTAPRRLASYWAALVKG
jgi:hypothetical protein